MTAVMVRHSTYEHETLRPIVFEMMEAMGGKDIRGQGRVLIKPNLLVPATPDQAILTHPAIVRSAAEYVLDRGARPLIADSPAMGSFETLLRKSGIREALRGLDVECRPFEHSVMVDIGSPFGAIAIAEEAVQADAIINLAKLKTHSQMLLTLTVKNLFGCIVGYRKPEWHLRTGVDRQMFARLLVQIARTVKPAFNILDGIMALEGQGPGRGGSPKRLGVLLAGNDPFAVDWTVCRMIGLDADQLPILKAAREMEGLSPHPEIDGPLPEVRGLRLPRMTSLVYGPKFLQGLIRRQLLQRPLCDEQLCQMCGECWTICPAKAIAPGEKPLHFDYDRCIRCYCCLEVCPLGAIRSSESLTGRVVRQAAAFLFPAGGVR
ncbi:MAG: DUF362 domain-containing protein [Deltaproteobacteria bacterium]|nr:DUF362 domain-containing protein [Deltaproteobacteria bacterium]